MISRLYVIKADDTVLYVGKVKDTLVDWIEEQNKHIRALENEEEGALYDAIRYYKKEKNSRITIKHLQLLEYMPGWNEEKLEEVRRGLVFGLAPIGNKEEWQEAHEQMVDEMD